MMTLAIMQPYIFPYLGYFQLIHAANRFVVYDDVTFIKQGWINRNNILYNKSKYLFTIPAKSISSNTLIKEIRISAQPAGWHVKLLKSIETSYKKAPHFNTVFPIIEETLTNAPGEIISDVAVTAIKKVVEYLRIDTDIISSSSIYDNRELKGEDRIIDICKRANADCYLNLPGGVALYDPQLFMEQKLQLKFISTGEIQYPQFGDTFIPNLSIIDVLMFNSREESINHLNNYSLSVPG